MTRAKLIPNTRADGRTRMGKRYKHLVTALVGELDGVATEVQLGLIRSYAAATISSEASEGAGMKPLVTLRRALTDPELLGASLSGNSWGTWRTMWLAFLGEQLVDDELLAFRQLTQRHDPPTER